MDLRIKFYKKCLSGQNHIEIMKNKWMQQKMKNTILLKNYELVNIH